MFRRGFLPHLKNRAMVMKRYPNGINGEFFFMKRAPSPRPDSIPICSIEHGSGNVIDFPVIQHLASLLWVVNLGCIDLNPWYARCDDVDRPDYLHFDLDPDAGASFKRVLETALLVRDALDSIKIKSYAKTTGSRGMHVYIPIERGPSRSKCGDLRKHSRKNWSAASANNYGGISRGETAARAGAGGLQPECVEPHSGFGLFGAAEIAATVSTPVTWEEVERGMRMEDFTVKNVPARLRKLGDLWRPLLEEKNRVDLKRFL